MKLLSALILFMISGYAGAQVFPVEFKVDKNSYSNITANAHAFNSPVRIILNQQSSCVESPIISNFISDIIVVGDTIWFGTGRGISRTLNNGTTFQNYYGSPPFGEDDVSGIAVYNNFVVVSTATSRDVGSEQNVPFGTGIKVSSDYGLTWNAYPQPVDGPGDTVIQYGVNNIKATPITSTAKNLSYDVHITRKNLTSDSIVIWITSWAGMFRKSTDYGATFSRVLLPPDNRDSISPGETLNFIYDPRDNIGNDNHKCFSVTSENDSTIYCGTAGGINKSTDRGVSWKKYYFVNTGNGSGISGNFVVALEFQRYLNRSVLWGATNTADASTGVGQFSAVSFTSNSGTSWGNTLDNAVFSHNIGFKDSIVYAATDNGIWRSFFQPGNFTWSKPSVIYDEKTKDQVRTNLFYAVNSKSDSVWVGSGDGLAVTTDTVVAPWVGKWTIFRAFMKLASKDETYAAPNPFSPDDEVCRIYFKTEKSVSSVTIRIFDFGMNPVRILLQNAPRTVPCELWTSWDGKRDDGMQVANGVYFYRIEVDRDVTAWGKILVLQ